MSQTNSSSSEQQSKRLRAQEELPLKRSTDVLVSRFESLLLPQDMRQPEWAYEDTSSRGNCESLVEYFEGKVTLHYWYKTWDDPIRFREGNIKVSYQKFDLETEFDQDLHHVVAKIEEGKVTRIYALWASLYPYTEDLDRLVHISHIYEPSRFLLEAVAKTDFSFMNMVNTLSDILKPHPSENFCLVKRRFWWTAFTALDKAVNGEIKGKMRPEHTVCVSRHEFVPVSPEWRYDTVGGFERRHMDPKELFEILPPVNDL